MQHYSSQVFTDIGKPAGGATITVRPAGSSTNATIYSDDGVTVKSNPFQANNLGQIDFYAASGKYDITVTGASITTYTLPNQVVFDPFESNAADLPVVTTGNVPMNSVGVGGFIGVQIWPAPQSGTSGPIVSANNQVRVYQFILPFAVTIGRVVVGITNNVASTVADVGIYNTAGSRLVFTNGGINTGTGGTVTVPITGGPIVLAAGFYYFAHTCTSILVQMNTVILALSNGENQNGARNGIAANAATSGVLPPTLGTITTDVTQPPVAAFFER